jgi:hypothetical protein
MIIIILLGIAVLYLFLKDAYESTEDLIGMRWAIFILTATALVLTVIVGQYVTAFLRVFTHWH